MKKSTTTPLLRYSAIALALYGFAIQANAACSYDSNTVTLDNQACNIDSTLVTDTTTKLTITSPSTTIQQQGRIDINTNLSGSDIALHLESSLGLKWQAQIGRNNTVNIENEAIAIQFDGTNIARNSDGFVISNGSTVKGKTYAIYIPNLNEDKYDFRIAINNGNIDGNIFVKPTPKQRQIYIGASNSGTIRSSNIQGISNVISYGNLTIASGTTGSNWNQASLVTQENSNLNFLLEEASLISNSTALLNLTNATINNSTALALTLGTDVTASDIENQSIVLINAVNSLTNNVTDISVYDNTGSDITSTLQQAGTQVHNDGEWLVTQQQKGRISLTTNNNQLLFYYDPSNTISLVTDTSKDNFLANTEYYQDFVSYILDSSLGAENERQAILMANPSNIAASEISRQLLPDLSGADINAAWIWGEQMRNNIENRLLAYQHQLPLYEREEGWNLWVNSSLAQGKNNNLFGYKLKRYGVQIGMDRQVETEGLLGFSVGVNRSDINSQFSDINKKMTQLLFMPYFEWNGKFYFASANLLGGAYSVDSKRTIANTTAEGDYTGFQFGYQLSGGINTSFKGIQFRPFLSMKEQWVQNEAWTETSSPFALSTERQKYKARHIGTGISIWKTFNLERGKFVPSLDIQYYKQMGDRHFRPEYKLVDDNSLNVPVGQFNLSGITGNQFITKFNASFNVSENFNLSGALSYNKLGDYKEAVIGFSLSNTF